MAWICALATFTVGALIVAWRWAGRRNEYLLPDGSTARRWRGPQGDGEAVRDQPPSKIDAGFYQVLNRYEVRPADVSVLIIDLARRGFLQIEQIAAPDARGRGGEWSLSRTDTTKEQREQLKKFEHVLLQRLFSGEESVRVNALRRSFGPHFVAVQNEIYRYVVEAGLFRAEPLDIKVSWRRGASGLIVLSAFVWVLLRPITEFSGAIALAVLAVGIATAVISNFVGARTAAGSAAALEGGDFKRSLQFGTAGAEPIDADVFVDYLPYAHVFGAAEQWAQNCVNSGAGPVAPGRLRLPAWAIAQRAGTRGEELGAEVAGFHEHARRVVGSSKAEAQRRA